MILFIDATRLIKRRLQGKLPTGIDRVCLKYVAHWDNSAYCAFRLFHLWFTLPHKQSNQLFSLLTKTKQNSWLVLARVFGLLVGAKIGFQCPRGGYLLNVAHSGLEHERYADAPTRHDLHCIFFIHDLIPILHPHFCRSGTDRVHTKRIYTALTKGALLIVASLHIRSDLERFATLHSLKLPPIVIAPLASPLLPKAMPTTTTIKNYFVAIGTLEPRKNHALLIAVWSQLVATLGDAAPHLVILGQPSWACRSASQLLGIKSAEIGHRVIIDTYCTDEPRDAWLHHARALLAPSFAEGYGLTLLEALTARVPVIASDLAEFRVFAGGVPDYLRTDSVHDWVSTISEYSTPNSTHHANQMSRMQTLTLPSWPEHFALVEDALKQLYVS